MSLHNDPVQMRQLKEEKGDSVIPSGSYCYDENGICPYWDRDSDRPHQYDGYCWYVERGDLDLQKDMEFTNEDTGETVKGEDMPIPVSLLWDQCKECGVNDDDEDVDLITRFSTKGD